MKVAIVYDYLVDTGGGERVVAVFHELYPKAPIYTSIYNPETTFICFREMDVRISFLQHITNSRHRYKWLLPLYPLAFKSFDLSEYDVVLSVSSAWAKGILASAKTVHINYCLTPMRFAWNYDEYMKHENLPAFMKNIISLIIFPLRAWDTLASKRVDYFIAISKAIKKKIERIYGREATIIYPPIRCSDFAVNESSMENWFLIVSRLVPYKRIDIAIEAFNCLGLPLMIVGDGRDRERLERMAGPNIHFVGWVSDEELKRYYRSCRAFIFTGEEDFGLTPLEAQASGRPVIAYGAGGALETVVEGATGTFFYEQTPEALIEAVKGIDKLEFDPKKMRKHAEKFDVEVFKRKINSFISEKWMEHREKSRGISNIT